MHPWTSELPHYWSHERALFWNFNVLWNSVAVKFPTHIKIIPVNKTIRYPHSGLREHKGHPVAWPPQWSPCISNTATRILCFSECQFFHRTRGQQTAVWSLFQCSSGIWLPLVSVCWQHTRGNMLNSHLYMYSISQKICTRFLFCCALLWLYIDWFSHIHQAYFTGTVAI